MLSERERCLKLLYERPPQATYTAAVYLHRFYAIHSLQDFPIRVRLVSQDLLPSPV